LQGVAVGVAHSHGIFDAGVKLWRNRFRDFDALLAQKLDGVIDLAVIGKLQSERGALGVVAQAERTRRQGNNARVVLGVAAQE
jgi:hypothetical protein